MPATRIVLALVTGAAVAAGLTAGLTTAGPAGRDSRAAILSLSPASDTLITTITKLTVSPNSAQGSVATLAATEAAVNGAHPAGWVQFQAGDTDIGAPVAVSAAGVATTTAAILGAAPAAAALSAAFTPATSAYLASAATAATAAQRSGTVAGAVAIEVTVPQGGNFTIAVEAGTVQLQSSTNPPCCNRGLRIATGVLQSVTVSDGRNSAPGWSVTGQESDFIGKGRAAHATIPGTQLGWVPTGSVTGGAALGGAVAPGSPGLGSAGALLAAAAGGSGAGTQTLGADLTLRFPISAPAGPYLGMLTITYVAAGRPPAGSAQFPPAS